MRRDSLYILEIIKKNIGSMKTYEYISTSVDSLIKITDYISSMKNKYINYKFSIIKINHNNSKNKLYLLNQSKIYQTEAFLNVCITNNMPVFSYNKSENDYYANNEIDILFINSETFFRKEDLENKNIILNDRQKKHLEIYEWIDIYNE